MAVECLGHCADCPRYYGQRDCELRMIVNILLVVAICAAWISFSLFAMWWCGDLEFTDGDE